MEFMLDTLNLEEIKKWSEVLPLAGVTSNPTIAKKEGQIDFFKRIQEVREVIGQDPSIHVQVVAQDFEGILKDAQEIRRQAGADIYVKVPVTVEGHLRFSLSGSIPNSPAIIALSVPCPFPVFAKLPCIYIWAFFMSFPNIIFATFPSLAAPAV